MKITVFPWLFFIFLSIFIVIFPVRPLSEEIYHNNLGTPSSGILNSSADQKSSKKTSVTTEEDILVSIGTDAKHSPVMAVDGEGNLWSAYVYYNTTYYLLDILKSTNDGDNWKRETIIYHTRQISNPDIAIDLYDNNIYVVFETIEISNASSYDISLFRYNQQDIIDVANGTQNDRFPSIAIDPTFGDGNYLYIAHEHIVDDDNRKLVVQKSMDGGTTWEKWHDSGYTDNFVYSHPDIIADYYGFVYVTYAFGEDDDTLTDINIEYGARNSNSPFFENFRNPFSSSDITKTVSTPVIAISRSSQFTTAAVIAFEYSWTSDDHDVYVVSSVNGGDSWLLNFVGATDTWEGKPNIISGGMDLTTDVLRNFYLIYGIVTQDDEWFVIQHAPYSNPTNWTTSPPFQYYLGIKDIVMTTTHVFGITSYSNVLTVSYAADQQIYLTRYSVDYTGGDTWFTIVSPNISSSWTTGTIERIEWETIGLIDDVDILLFKGLTVVEWIAESIENVGYYDWEVSDIEPGSDYVMYIGDSNNSEVYAISFQFVILNSGFTFPKIYFTNPTPVSAWRAGATYVITWNCKVELGTVKLELYKGDALVTVISWGTDGEGHLKWRIPTDTPTGNDYRLRIYLESNPGIEGFSDKFRIIIPQTTISRTIVLATPALPTPWCSMETLVLSLIVILMYQRIKFNLKKK